jgi:hypothetical protein
MDAQQARYIRGTNYIKQQRTLCRATVPQYAAMSVTSFDVGADMGAGGCAAACKLAFGLTY